MGGPQVGWPGCVTSRVRAPRAAREGPEKNHKHMRVEPKVQDKGLLCRSHRVCNEQSRRKFGAEMA